MTITTELLISESQSQKIIPISKIIHESYKQTINQTNSLDLDFSFENKDVKKLLINNLIINICEFKKNIDYSNVVVLNREEFDSCFLEIIDEVINKMELNKKEKSKNFFSKFKKYLKTNELQYINNVYLKQVSNKLALFR